MKKVKEPIRKYFPDIEFKSSKKEFKYKITYELRLFDVEPFTNIGSKISNFLNDLTKHNLISKYLWIIVDNKKVKYKTLKKIYKYLKKKLNEYRSE